MAFAKDETGNYLQAIISKAPQSVVEDSEYWVRYVASTSNTYRLHGLNIVCGGRTPWEALRRLADQVGAVKVVAQHGVDMDRDSVPLSQDKADAHWIGETLRVND